MMTGTWTAAYLVLAAATGAPEAPANPAYEGALNQTRFEIPIRVVAERRQEIRSLELYCSTNQGKTWDMVKTATPADSGFPFTAPADGIYWFIVIVRDLQNRPEPPSPYKAAVGQKVLVKTQKPDLRLTAERQGERIAVRWEAREEYPDLSTFRLEYKPADGSGEWTPVPATQALVGQASFASAAAVTVRATLEDVAKNAGQVEARVPAASGVVTASALSPVSEGPPSAIAPPTAVTPSAKPSENLLPPVFPAEGPPAGTTDTVPPRKEESRGSTVPPPVKVVGPAHENLSPPPSRTEGPANVVATAPLEVKPAAPAGEVPAVAPASDATLQVVNNRRVTMEYQVDKIGPSGVGGVDLYMTTDNGNTWLPVKAEHSAAASPAHPGEPLRRTLTVVLSGADGLYGFTMVVRSGAGLGRPAPKHGDSPEMRLELDTKAPDAALYRPEPCPGQRDSLVICWKASDKNLGERPIALEWSEQPRGDWKPIGDRQLLNRLAGPPTESDKGTDDRREKPTGSIIWRVPANTPPKVYLRLTVRDSAGNAAIAETPEPVSVDLIQPSHHFIGLVRGAQ